VFGGSANRSQQLIEPVERRGYGAGRQAFEDRSRKLDFLASDLGRSQVARRGQVHSLCSSVVGVADAAQETAILETRDISGEGTGGDPQAFRELAETQRAICQRLERRSLSDRHPTTTHIRPLGERKTAHQGTDALLKLACLGIGEAVGVISLSHQN
jgi:hypothetical protein